TTTCSIRAYDWALRDASVRSRHRAWFSVGVTTDTSARDDTGCRIRCDRVAAPFVSHAQNFEDVILWRALSGLRDGFYIDVLASGPLWGSVTRVLSDRGWRGINVEPDPEPYAALVAVRPRDVNLNVGVSNAVGEAEMTFVPGTGNSTLDPGEG